MLTLKNEPEIYLSNQIEYKGWTISIYRNRLDKKQERVFIHRVEDDYSETTLMYPNLKIAKAIINKDPQFCGKRIKKNERC